MLIAAAFIENLLCYIGITIQAVILQRGQDITAANFFCLTHNGPSFYAAISSWDSIPNWMCPMTALEIRHFTFPNFGSCTALSNTLMFVPTHLLL